MRQFRHLTSAEIREIILRHNGGEGEKQADLARAFNVDHSTINYHLNKYERAYPEQGGVYSLIKIQLKRTCQHPSSRCTLCGDMWDQIRRSETETIQKLRKALADAHQQLRFYGIDVEMPTL